MKPIRAWGGFCDGKLCWEGVLWSSAPGSDRALHAVFNTRKQARAHYDDVRPVIISEAPRVKRRSSKAS